MYIDQLRRSLIENNLTISVCETFTAGNFISMLTKNMKNPSEILRYSCVGFSNKFKIKHMNVNKNLIRRHGPHSVECAKEIAYNLKQETKADISVCFIRNPFPANEMNQYPINILSLNNEITPKTCYAVIALPDNTWDWFEIPFKFYWKEFIAENIREESVEFIAQQILNYL
ncbi:CinA family protein [Mycoplasma yeatsii]|uniref:CinA family protein n=1 Tax=Mycoplasma yeatsii TaxID=51365 RepID=UPI0005B24FBB|nr:CinA family protein [Mycoplasma yeatsii]AJM71857.1 putative competence-damage inducible protein [Mycoplasma yeatsii GM274B]